MNVLVKRFLTNIKNPKMREKVGIYFAGNGIGLAILFMAISFFIVHPAHAQRPLKDWFAQQATPVLEA
jgi:hypothetical protein